ncbi:TetR/AcrR family transcriptional regulator [Burkholderia plantarii]|uniref:acrylate utilization transcriptional regulator AcuR n=1 Tax=Burkholderia plantarii TaxID=41899 RepID=UPI0006D8BFC9|nr:TetR/AcrR family transcriptional regulator [Burkholderia plantarii]ALK30743.1 TetR family transcriptional regulator [Burkholderia plantarii]WLE59457.1 TetR/AcrR family transcriptional regulator [Burkholderia plantarii]GLZ19361.1 TetR family transcriptional regulator [Burkholderia plantarii]
MLTPPDKPRRGRPPKNPQAHADTRAVLLRAGMELLTEQGFAATGLDTVLKRVDVPKGSFYHYFASKEAFGRELMDAYDAYFAAKLDHWLLDASRPALARLAAFVDDAKAGMARHDFTRGCLIGNLGLEVGALPDGFREALERIFAGWQARIARCLRDAQHERVLAADADLDALAAFFWIGWEGAVLRARLVRNATPLDTFFNGFLAGLPRSRPARAPARPPAD